MATQPQPLPGGDLMPKKKSKGGRPPLDVSRFERVTIKVKPDEKEKIEWLASVNGLQTASYVRKLLLDEYAREKRRRPE